MMTILEHFNGRFTNQYETVRSLLNALRYRHLGEFRWYKDTYLSRVMELPEKRVKKTLKNSQGAIPFGNFTNGKLIGACTQEGINLSNELKLSRQLKMNKLRERSQLGDFCVQFGLPYVERKGLDKDLGKNGKSDKLIVNLIDLVRIDLAPNCKFEKLKTQDLEEDLHDKVYSFLYTSGFESDYDDDNYSESGSKTYKPETSGNTQSTTIYACKCRGDICSCEHDEFYKLQSQFEDLNMNTITSDNLAAKNKASSSNIVERSKNEFKYSTPYSLSEVNNRLSKQHVVIRDTSFDNLKGEIE
ncbi:hypothetical protein H5410_060960 [Solanum commersonii]|uniref:Uncharacterized protein n=1 Tax=Solanum commersonii TaxID=4109 RepID=A0A9J5W6N0_SOLCO|nr:hypothetical protein H5410_060960 [Solanum commersonii]